MKAVFRSALLSLLLAMVLATVALADFAPKPQLTVRVNHPPQERYYLDILAEGTLEGDYCKGPERSYTDEELDRLDETLLQALRDAVPPGWYACTAEGTPDYPLFGQLYSPEGNGMHGFSYLGVPKEYRLILVTESGDAWVSEPYSRQTLQASVTVDWPSGSVTQDAPIVHVPPPWPSFVLHLLSTLLPTLLIEGLVMMLFRISLRKNWKPFLGVNLLTQLLLFLLLGIPTVQNGMGAAYFVLLIPAELLILLTETLLYRRCLTGCSRSAATAFGITANLLSALAGFFLATPLWRWVISLS